MKILILVASFLLCGLANAQTCSSERSVGADYFQAKYNCEVMLKGNALNCTPYGNMWGCSCSVCSGGGSGGGGGNFTRTIGTDYGQARYNCEVVLQGSAGNCQPSVNNLWYCDCNY